MSADPPPYPRPPADADFNPYTSRLIDADSTWFIGRRSHLVPMLQGVSASSPISFAIRGARGIGETAMLKDLCDPKGASLRFKETLLIYRPDQKEQRLEFLYFDAYNLAPKELFKGLLARLLKIPAAVDLPAALHEKAWSAASIEELKSALADILENLAEKTVRLAICLDHFDKAYKELDYENDNFLRYLTTNHAFIFVTEKSFFELMDDHVRHSPLGNKLKMLPPLGLLEESEARDLVQGPALSRQRPFAEQTVDFILHAAGRHPYLLNLVCEYLYNQLHSLPARDQGTLLIQASIQDQFLAQILALPAVDDLFRTLWNRAGASEAQEQLVAIAQNPPTDPQVAAHYGRLVQDSLLWLDLKTRRYQLFSELFRLFVLKQPGRPPAVPDLYKRVLKGLSAQDSRLLDYLAEHKDRICSFDELLTTLWAGENPSKRVLEAAIHRIRLKYKELGGEAPLRSVRGQGLRYGV